MRKTVQARLDGTSRRSLTVLVQELGWSLSRVVQEGLRMVEASRLRKKRRGVVGLGQFSSRLANLGSNKKHLEGFGK
jgi:hypothetical protein